MTRACDISGANEKIGMKTEFDPKEEEILAQIGLILILVQDLEYILLHDLRLVFGDDKIISIEELFSSDRRTLGAFVTKLKQSVELEKGFERLLDDLVKERNIFVHRLRQQSWFHLEIPEGRKATLRFLFNFFNKLEVATKIFQAFAIKQAKDCRMPETPQERTLRAMGFMDELESKYFPKLPALVKRRK